MCRNYKQDRIIPRMARHLADRLGWVLTAAPEGNADVLHLSAYFEVQKVGKWPTVPVSCYFTHIEIDPPGNAKAALFDSVAQKVDLRMAMCRIYGQHLEQFGPTIQPPLPVELDRFVIVPSPKSGRGRKTVVGLSGYTYSNHRKGEDLVREMVKSQVGQRVEWKASGRGWPVPMQRYAWKDMPKFFQGLDVLVCPSRVEGGPLPVLEALACGVRVVVPSGVGIIDELPKVKGIYRYKCGDLKSLLVALEHAADMKEKVDREALRKAVEKHSVAAFVEAHRVGIEELMDQGLDAGIVEVAPSKAKASAPIEIKAVEPVEQSTGKKRGIYCVAFGDPSRKCALRLMKSAKQHMPDIPIALCAAKKIGPEDVLIVQPDSDVGGRRAKLKAYELAPAEWDAVLYLDADTEAVAPIYYFWELIEDGWEFVIAKDPHLMDTMHAFRRKNNALETAEVEKTVRTLHTLQYNGGVWAFGRNKRIAAFFQRWQAEWERHAQRDQGALIRAMYTDPLKVMLLGNQWNTFLKYCKGIETAGLMHYPGDARRWKGMIPGRIDSPKAWQMVKELEKRNRGKRR